MGLEDLRARIREKDEIIIRTIAERTAIAEEIGRLKSEAGLSIRDKTVEAGVIERYRTMGEEAGLDPSICESIARMCIEEAVSGEIPLVCRGIAKRIAVVGGSGRMGSWVCGLLGGTGGEIVVIDPASGSGSSIEDCRGCDVIIVSVPIGATASVLESIDSIAGEDALIMDLTSLKTPVSGILKRMASRRRVCSVHPMFGPSAASMCGRNVIVCDCGCGEAVSVARSFIEERGGEVRVMDIDDHDEYMSYVLGLSHAVNIAFFTVLERSGISFEDMRSVASTTFGKNLDTNLSVALEDPSLYYEIQHLNSHREEMWDLFTDAVDDLRRASLSDDPGHFKKLMDDGRRYFSE